MKTLQRLALFLLFLTNQSVDSLYIRRGNLRLGLMVGPVAFLVMIASVIPVTELFLRGKDLNWARSLFHAAMDIPVFVGIFSNL